MQSLGRTPRRWLTQITHWHHAGVGNGPNDAVNNPSTRIKRIGFGFRRLWNYRIRAQPYAGRPNWNLLATAAAQTPAEIRRALFPSAESFCVSEWELRGRVEKAPLRS